MNILLTIELLAVVAISLYLFVSRKGAGSDPFAAIVPFMAFYVLNYIVRGFDLSFGISADYTGVLSKNADLLLPIAELVFIGILCFAAGYLLFRPIMKYKPNSAGRQIVSWSRVRLIHVGLCIIAAVVIVVLVVRANTTPFNYIAELNYYRLNVNNDVAYLKFLVNLPGLTGILLYALACEKGKKRPWILIALPFFFNFLFAHRHFAVYYIFSLLTVHHYLIKRFKLWSIGSIVFVAFVANGLFGAWRDFAYVFPGETITLDGILETYSENKSFADVILYHTYFSGFQGIDAVYRIIDAIDNGADFHFGWRFLIEPIAGAIPYTVWPDKPIPLNTAINNLINGVDIDYYDPTDPAGGIVGTVLGDLYWAGGLIGIILGMFLIGMLFRFCQNIVLKRDAYSVFLYSMYYPILFMFISTIGSGLIRLVYFSVFAWFLYLIVTVRHSRLMDPHHRPTVKTDIDAGRTTPASPSMPIIATRKCT